MIRVISMRLPHTDAQTGSIKRITGIESTLSGICANILRWNVAFQASCKHEIANVFGERVHVKYFFEKKFTISP